MPSDLDSRVPFVGSNATLLEGAMDPGSVDTRVYVAVSQTAAAAAVERGKSDAAIVKRLQELEAMEKEKKRRRRLLGKSKALVKKSPPREEER